MRFCPFCSAENADDLAVCQACGRRLPPLPPRRGPARNAPPTGIQLPNRPAGSVSPPPRRPGSSSPAHLPVPLPVPAPVPTAMPQHDTSPEATTVEPDPVESTIVAPPLDMSTVERSLPPPPPPAKAPPAKGHGPTTGAPTYAPSGASGPTSGVPAVEMQLRDSAPALPPPPSPTSDDNRRQLANAIQPGPAAQRRDAGAEPRIPADRRGRNDSKQPLSPTALSRHPPSQPPPVGFGQPAAKPAPPTGPNNTALGMRPHPPSQPPPMRRAPSVPPPIPGSGPNQASQFGGDTFVTDNDFSRPQIQALLSRDTTEPPPTRIRTEAMVDRPFTPSQVLAVPEIPEPGLVKAARKTRS